MIQNPEFLIVFGAPRAQSLEFLHAFGVSELQTSSYSSCCAFSGLPGLKTLNFTYVRGSWNSSLESLRGFGAPKVPGLKKSVERPGTAWHGLEPARPPWPARGLACPPARLLAACLSVGPPTRPTRMLARAPVGPPSARPSARPPTRASIRADRQAEGQAVGRAGGPPLAAGH